MSKSEFYQKADKYKEIYMPGVDVRDYLSSISDEMEERWNMDGWDEKVFTGITFGKERGAVDSPANVHGSPKLVLNLKYTNTYSKETTGSDINYKTNIFDLLTEAQKSRIENMLSEKDDDLEKVFNDQEFKDIIATINLDKENEYQRAWIKSQDSDYFAEREVERNNPATENGVNEKNDAPVALELTEEEILILDRIKNLHYFYQESVESKYHPGVMINTIGIYKSWGTIYDYDEDGKAISYENPEKKKLNKEMDPHHLINYSKADGFQSANFDGLKILKDKLIKLGTYDQWTLKDLINEDNFLENYQPKYEKYADFILAIESGKEPPSFDPPKGLEKATLFFKGVVLKLGDFFGSKEEEDLKENAAAAAAELDQKEGAPYGPSWYGRQ